MALLTKEELKTKITEKITDEDAQIELLEDIEDSFVENSEPVEDTEKLTALENEVAEWKSKYEETRAKYKERFFKGSEEDETSNDDSNDEELKEVEVVDINEI